MSECPARAPARAPETAETTGAVGSVGADALLDFPKLTPEIDQVASRAPGDLEWLLASPRWNPKGTVLTPGQKERLTKELRAKQEAYLKLNSKLTLDAACLARDLDARGELAARVAVGQPEGFHRRILTGRGDQSIDAPLTPILFPELAAEILAANAECQSIADFVLEYLANPP